MEVADNIDSFCMKHVRAETQMRADKDTYFLGNEAFNLN